MREEIKDLIIKLKDANHHINSDNTHNEHGVNFIIEALESEIEKDAGLLSENKKLRRLLWLSHGCQGLYGDDGEMQCNECRIDFLRDSADDIELKIIKKKNPEYYKMLTSDQAIKEESQ